MSGYASFRAGQHRIAQDAMRSSLGNKVRLVKRGRGQKGYDTVWTSSAKNSRPVRPLSKVMGKGDWASKLSYGAQMAQTRYNQNRNPQTLKTLGGYYDSHIKKQKAAAAMKLKIYKSREAAKERLGLWKSGFKRDSRGYYYK